MGTRMPEKFRKLVFDVLELGVAANMLPPDEDVRHGGLVRDFLKCALKSTAVI